jgi:hypothetical protein
MSDSDKKLGQLDLCFMVDETGSMGPYIETVKQKILEIIHTGERTLFFFENWLGGLSRSSTRRY